MTKSRILYIDNLRIFLTALVVLHHLAITYGAPGGWFYNESVAGFPEILPFSMFVATNQAFFMGMFFFISAFFLLPSLRKKGMNRFIRDRLIRLGIPTLLFFFILFPLTIYIRNHLINGDSISFLFFIKTHEFGFGPMWFVEALILFTTVYLFLARMKLKVFPFFSGMVPTPVNILLLAFLVGVGQFIIRIWLPVGWAMPFTEFQLPHFLQYIVLFGFGALAYEQRWLDYMSPREGWRWFWFTQFLILIGFPLIFILGGAMDRGIDHFMGGLNWSCFSYTIWEQIVGFSMIMALFGLFKAKLNQQGSFARKLSASAYAVYVFHAPILVFIGSLFLEFKVQPFFKFIALAPVALASCFLLAYLVKQLPVFKRIF